MASSAGPISGVGRSVANQPTPGDIVVSRIRGPFEAYVIGRIYADAAGDRRCREDLTVEGSIEGTMDLREHVLTIGPHGHIKAEIFVKVAIVEGAVTGTITASEKVELRERSMGMASRAASSRSAATC